MLEVIKEVGGGRRLEGRVVKNAGQADDPPNGVEAFV